MRKVTGQILLILYSFLFLLILPADLDFVVGFLVALICIGVQMFIKNDWKMYLFLTGVLIGACFCRGICEFLPVIFYGFWTKERRGIMVLAVAGGIFTSVLGDTNLNRGQWCLLVFGILLSMILKLKEDAYEELEQEYKKTRDDSKERNLLLQEKNRNLIEKQDYEIYTATLRERNRIAREIHDNVGHLLSRSILMVGAMKIINEDEKLSPSIEQLEDSLNTAMTSVRESVHDLHDDSVNLKEVTEELVEEFTFCPVDLSYDMGYDVPREIKYSFIAIVKEALHNIVRHSDASKVKIVMREHPAIYQLIVEDNGTVKEKVKSVGTKEMFGKNATEIMSEGVPNIEENFTKIQPGQGMGLRNMSDRVHMLGGVMQIVRKEGFRIFITIPKEVA